MDDNVGGGSPNNGEASGAGGGGGSAATSLTTFTVGGGGASGAISPFRQAQTNLSFIDPGEEEKQAQELIDAQFRVLTKSTKHPDGVTFREHARMTRYFCAVKLYVRPEELSEITRDDGTKATLYLPDTVRAEDRFQACCGLVVSLGPDAFTTKDGRPRGSRYGVGDFLVFPRSDIIRIDFCGVAMGIMTDDRAVIVTDDPTLWTVGGMTFKA